MVFKLKEQRIAYFVKKICIYKVLSSINEDFMLYPCELHGFFFIFVGSMQTFFSPSLVPSIHNPFFLNKIYVAIEKQIYSLFTHFQRMCTLCFCYFLFWFFFAICIQLNAYISPADFISYWTALFSLAWTYSFRWITTFFPLFRWFHASTSCSEYIQICIRLYTCDKTERQFLFFSYE